MGISPRQVVYGALAIIGVVATTYFNLKFMRESGGGFSVGDFVAGGYANPAAGSISNDLIVADVAFLIWSFFESRRLGMRWWGIYFVLNFTVAFAFAFPLFLLMRERKLEAAGPATA